MSKKTLSYPEREVALVLAAVKSAPVFEAAVSAGMLAEHLTQPPVAAVWSVLVELHEAGEEIRGVSMLELLRARKMEEACKPLLHRVQNAPAPSEAAAYADAEKIVAAARARASERTIADALVELHAAADPQEALAVLKDRVFSVAVEEDRARAKRSTQAALEAVFRKITDPKARSRRIVGIATFIDGLDAKTRGWQLGKVVIIGARPGAGKTAFLTSTLAAQIEQHDPAQHPMPPCLFISLEMDDDELVSRLLCAMANIDYDSMMYGAVPADEHLRRIAQAADFISRAPLDIDDETPRTVEQIAAEIYRWKRRRFQRGAKVNGSVLIDYLTRIKRSPGIRTLQDHVMHCMAVLADVAKRTGLAIVVLSQLTRGHVKEARMPEMDDLKGGGDVEENAFHVVILHPMGRAEDAAAGRPWRGAVAALIEKNRGGPMGMVMLKFEGSLYRFRAWRNELDGSLDDVMGAMNSQRGQPQRKPYKPTQKPLIPPPAKGTGSD